MPVRLNSTGGGSVTLDVPATSGTFTVNLPAANGDVVVTGGGSTVQFGAGSAAAPSITFSGDTNTGIYSPAADTIAFTEGGVEAMRLDASGNVGIGGLPFDRLDVHGGTTVRGVLDVRSPTAQMLWSTNTYGGLSLTNGTVSSSLALNTNQAELRAISNHPYLFYTNNLERMRIDPVGNVGIGTSSPAVRFHVNSGAADEVARFEGTGSPFITLFDTNVRQFYLSAAANSVDMVVEPSKALTFGTNNAERMRIDASGNVGIGVNTISPPSGFSRFIAIGDTDTGIGQISDGVLAFGTNGSVRMRITDSGISIGSASVNARLTVDGQGPQLTNQAFAFYAQSGGATSTGYVSGQTIQNSIWASDRVSGGEFNARSDGRLKKDVTPIPASDAWQFVQNVPAVYYKWINGPDDGHKFGFIAQDVVKAGFPNLVGQYPDSNVQEVTDADGFTSPAGVMLSVNYDQIVPVLASALRDALSRIETLEARLAAVEAR